MVPFWWENQNVTAWAYLTADSAKDDPPVYMLDPETGTLENVGAGPWLQAAESMTTFLLQMTVFRAMTLAHGTYGGWGWPESAEVKEIADRFTALPLGSWRWPAPPTTWYGGADTLVMTVGAASGRQELWITCQSRKAFMRHRSLIREWQWWMPPDLLNDPRV